MTIAVIASDPWRRSRTAAGSVFARSASGNRLPPTLRRSRSPTGWSRKRAERGGDQATMGGPDAGARDPRRPRSDQSAHGRRGDRRPTRRSRRAGLALPAGVRYSPARRAAGRGCARTSRSGSGIDVVPVLGSRSTDTARAIWSVAVACGGRARGRARSRHGDRHRRRRSSAASTRRSRSACGPGPRVHWFADPLAARSSPASWLDAPTATASGSGSTGPPLRTLVEHVHELPSEGPLPAAVQVPHDGRPIVMLADHPVTGGWPGRRRRRPRRCADRRPGKPRDGAAVRRIHRR